MTTETLKVFHILEGPYHSSEVDDPDYEGLDEFICICKVILPDGSVSDEEIHFDDLDDFYEMKRHLDSSVEPYEIELEYVE